MKLWLVERAVGTIGYDEFCAHVVRAPSAQTARQMSADLHGDEGASAWFDPETRVLDIGVDGEQAIVLSSFNAG